MTAVWTGVAVAEGVGLAVGADKVAVAVNVRLGEGVTGRRVGVEVRGDAGTVTVGRSRVGVLDEVGSGTHVGCWLPGWLPEARGISTPARTARIKAPMVRIRFVRCSPKRIPVPSSLSQSLATHFEGA
jgi:hypothetical protein